MQYPLFASWHVNEDNKYYVPRISFPVLLHPPDLFPRPCHPSINVAQPEENRLQIFCPLGILIPFFSWVVSENFLPKKSKKMPLTTTTSLKNPFLLRQSKVHQLAACAVAQFRLLVLFPKLRSPEIPPPANLVSVSFSRIPYWPLTIRWKNEPSHFFIFEHRASWEVSSTVYRLQTANNGKNKNKLCSMTCGRVPQREQLKQKKTFLQHTDLLL